MRLRGMSEIQANDIFKKFSKNQKKQQQQQQKQTKKKLARQNSFEISRILTAVKPETRLQGYCAKVSNK